MVALLIVLTIIGCLVADAIVVTMRERRAVAMSGQAVPEMVFAQDGGEPVDDQKEALKKEEEGHSGKE